MTSLRTLLLSAGMALGSVTALPGAAAADIRNIVLVHGANVDGSSWREVYDRLTERDFNVTIAQLPMTSTQDDVTAVRRNLEVQDGPVLLVGHSYGGVVITEAGVGEGVSGLVYVAAFQPDAGESAGGLMASAPGAFTPDSLTVFEDGHYLIDEDTFIDVAGNGLSEEDARYVARSQAMSNAANLEHEAGAAAWKDKPSWALIATEDRIITPELQRRMAERAGSTIVEIENGHMLPMTSPDEVAEAIAQAAGSLD